MYTPYHSVPPIFLRVIKHKHESLHVHLFSATTWTSGFLLDIQSGKEAYHGSAESRGDQCGFMEMDEESGLQRGGLTRIDGSIWSESIKSYLLKVQMVKGRWILKVLEFCSVSSVTAVRYRYMTILVFYTGRTSAVNAEIVLGLFIWCVKENEWQVISAVVSIWTCDMGHFINSTENWGQTMFIKYAVIHNETLWWMKTLLGEGEVCPPRVAVRHELPCCTTL